MSYLTFSYMNVMGFMLLIMYLLQLLTGLLLTIYYNDFISMSFDSMFIVVYLINNGWMISMLHVMGASLFMLLMMLHLISYMWIKIGVMDSSFIILIIMISGYLLFMVCMMEGFMGYLLCWGQMSYRGIIMMINIVAVLPCCGKVMAELIWSAAWVILNRIFVVHFFMGMLIGLMITLHMMLLHSFSSFNPYINNNSMIMSFYPMVIKDLCSVVVMLGYMISVLINLEPDILGNSDNQVIANPLITPYNILPEWYFLLFFSCLSSFPNSIIGLCLVIVLFMFIFI